MPTAVEFDPQSLADALFAAGDPAVKSCIIVVCDVEDLAGQIVVGAAVPLPMASSCPVVV